MLFYILVTKQKLQIFFFFKFEEFYFKTQYLQKYEIEKIAKMW